MKDKTLAVSTPAPMTILSDGAPKILAQALQIIVNSQHLIETDGPWADKQPTKDNIRQYSFALVDEVTEYAKELGWKDWKKPFTPDPERVMDEFADIIAFLGVILDYGMKLTNQGVFGFANQYEVKTRVNLERVAGKVIGYGSLEVQRSEAQPLQLGATQYTSYNYHEMSPQFIYQVWEGGVFLGDYVLMTVPEEYSRHRTIDLRRTTDAHVLQLDPTSTSWLCELKNMEDTDVTRPAD